jgi:hypothetical protein
MADMPAGHDRGKRNLKSERLKSETLGIGALWNRKHSKSKAVWNRKQGLLESQTKDFLES